MKGFSTDLIEILRLLENYPLKSYNELAEKIGVSTQTLIRRVKDLESRNIIRTVHSSLNPESMLLERYVVIFLVSSLDQVSLLELSCDIHPYTSSRNRIFGSEYGLYTKFDIPIGSYNHFKSFLEMMNNKEYCDKFFVYKSEGNRIFYPQPYCNNIMDIDDFDIKGYFSKKINEKNSNFQEKNLLSSSVEYHPIQLLILRDITTNMRTPMSQLLVRYKSYLNISKDKESFHNLPKGFKRHIKDYFSEEKTENAIYIDFKKKYHSILNKYVENYWLDVNRKYFSMFIRFAYVISGISKSEKSDIFNLLRNERPPFSIYLEDFGKYLYLSISLPPYYQTQFAYLMKLTYENFSTYLLDSFGYNAVKYRFYVHNYDIDKQKWRDDRDWMYDKVIQNIDDKVSENQFRSVLNRVE